MTKMKFKNLSAFWKKIIIILSATSVLLFVSLLIYIWKTVGQLLKVMI